MDRAKDPLGSQSRPDSIAVCQAYDVSQRDNIVAHFLMGRIMLQTQTPAQIKPVRSSAQAHISPVRPGCEPQGQFRDRAIELVIVQSRLH
jgi:hypothetical protein